MPFWKNERITPAQIIILGFLLLILCGAVLLTLPFAVNGPGRASFFDALFTATSATCVTGLVIHDKMCIRDRSKLLRSSERKVSGPPR